MRRGKKINCAYSLFFAFEGDFSHHLRTIVVIVDANEENK